MPYRIAGYFLPSMLEWSCQSLNVHIRSDDLMSSFSDVLSSGSGILLLSNNVLISSSESSSQFLPNV